MAVAGARAPTLTYSLCDMLAIQLAEDADLLLNVIDLILSVFKINDFDGDGCSSRLEEAAVDLAIMPEVPERSGLAGMWNSAVRSVSRCVMLIVRKASARNSPEAALADALLPHIIVFGIRTLRWQLWL